MKGPRLALRGFRPGARGPAAVLGDLEAAVMEVLWAAPGQTVTQVEDHLRRRRSIAHTTVLTTLDRLHRKGYLLRERDGKAFVYAPRFNREQFQRRLAEEVLAGLLAQADGVALSALVDLIETDADALARLERAIAARRAETGTR